MTNRAYHSVHKANEAPECYCIILLNCVDRSKEVAHSLDVAQTAVVFVVGKKHIFHLFEMDVGTNLGERRVWVRMWDIFSLKQRDMTVGAMNVFFCSDRKQWDVSAFFCISSESYPMSIIAHSPWAIGGAKV